MASGQVFLSWPYMLWIIGAVTVMGLYAVFWQRLLTRLPLSTAYMFKGTSLIFVLIISALVFGESISLTNVIGSAIIITGIILFAKA
ncbi:MAG: EamA family transporter [Bacteroidales bacterium]|nr:EamA family transporter [Bacteroidales bacterium]